MCYPLPSGSGSHHPSHYGARLRSPHVGNQRLGYAAQGVRTAIRTICGTGYVQLPSYPVHSVTEVIFNPPQYYPALYLDGQPTVIFSAVRPQTSFDFEKVPSTIIVFPSLIPLGTAMAAKLTGTV